MGVELSPDRASRLRRSFLRTGLDVPVRRWMLGETRLADASFPAAMISLAVLLTIEIPLWVQEPLPNVLSSWVSGRAAALALLVFPMNGILLDRLLVRRTNRPVSVPRRWIVLRFIVAVLPILNLYAPGLWRWIVEHKGCPDESRMRTCLDLTSGESSAPVHSLWRRPLWHVLVVALWMTTGIVLPMLWALWVQAEVVRGSSWRWPALGVCGLLHIVAAASLAHYFRFVRRHSQAAGWRAFLLSGLPLLVLLPMPVAIVPVMAMSLVDRTDKPGLIVSMYFRRWNASRLPLWSNLEASVLRKWREVPWWRQLWRPFGLERPIQAGLAERRLLDLYRWKGLLTAVDAIALVVALSVLGRNVGVFSPDRMLLPSLPSWFWASVALAFTGLAGEAAVLGARLLRASGLHGRLGRFPWGRAFLYPHVAFLAGMVAGQALVESWTRELCLWVVLTLALGVMTSFLAQVLIPDRLSGQALPLEARNLMGVPMFLLLVAAAELVLVLIGSAEAVVTAVRTVAILSPLWAVLSGLTLGKWLLRPYGWKDLWRRDLPPGRRAWLGFLEVTLLLPLGGLLIPLWVGARSRLVEPSGRGL